MFYANKSKVMEKIKVLLSQVDDAIAQDKAAADEAVSFTPEVLTEIAAKLRQSLSEQPAPKSREEKKSVREKQRQARQKSLKLLHRDRSDHRHTK